MKRLDANQMVSVSRGNLCSATGAAGVGSFAPGPLAILAGIWGVAVELTCDDPSGSGGYRSYDPNAPSRGPR